MKTNLLKDFLDSLEQKGIVGSAFALMKDGKPIMEYYRGMADKEAGKPIGPDTLFRMYSMTKIFTNVALMQLYEKGAFILSDPISLYLPEFAEMKIAHSKPNGMVDLRPATRPIRVEDIMGMTAGMVYGGGNDYASRTLTEKLKELEQANPHYTTRDYVKVVASCPLAYEPGTEWRYSTAHEVVGALVEVLSGERFSDYIDNHICKPLGLCNTFFRAPDEVREDRLARYYELHEDGTTSLITNQDKLYKPDAMMDRGGAGLMSTLGDYMRFADALTNGGTSRDGVRILGSETLRILRTNRLTPGQNADFDWDAYCGYGYGLGVRVLLYPEIAGGGNVGEFGWAGAAGTLVYMDQEKQLTAVYLEQARPTYESYIFPRLRNLIYASLDK